jgi:hypothetical protein
VPNGKRAASALTEQIKRSGMTIFRARISRTTECGIHAGSTFILGIGDHRARNVFGFPMRRKTLIHPY